MPSDPYNDLVRARFENPVHAAADGPGYAGQVSASAAVSGQGNRVTLEAHIVDGRIADIRFRAWGCPYLIAAAETVCCELEGRESTALKTVSANDLAAKLSVPTTRLGRLLLIEDAAARLLEKTGV